MPFPLTESRKPSFNENVARLLSLNLTREKYFDASNKWRDIDAKQKKKQGAYQPAPK